VRNIRDTPWGYADQCIQKAPGLWAMSTPGHGGFLVDYELLLQMPPAILKIQTFAGRGWYEEDCDWALVTLAFPEFFEPRDCFYAIETAKAWHKDKLDLNAYLESDPKGQTVKVKALKWFNEHHKNFEFGIMTGGAGGCSGEIISVDRTEQYRYQCDEWPKLEEPFTLEKARDAGLVITTPKLEDQRVLVGVGVE
jgi:hypothetical protein